MVTQQLKELIIKGFVLDDELLKNGSRFGFDYFSQLLERIRDIRSSERRFNQKITDIYATSFDYKKDAKITREFFATVQNKLIYAVSGQTAAEIIAERSDSDKINMGLTNWSNPNGKNQLEFTPILKGNGKISSGDTQKILRKEYGKYKVHPDYNYQSYFAELFIVIINSV